jgi:50S ribosomal protein L16 3-hydroxylase
VLDAWLAPLAVPAFLRTHLQRAPFASAGTAVGAQRLLRWETFDDLLAAPGAIDLLTVRAGQLVDAPVPGSLADVRALLAAGVSVVVRGAERNLPSLAVIVDGFSAHLPGEIHVQLYATPGGTNSYGWHYDFEDVFIAQTEGAKDYYFRDNSLARDIVLGDALDFSAARAETTPLYCSRLEPGDTLYLPSRWWHLVKCVRDSLSISVGVMPPEALRGARRVPAGWGDRRG